MQLHMLIETVLISIGGWFIFKEMKLGYYLFGAAILLFLFNLLF